MRKANDGKKGGYLKGQSHQECNDDTGCGIRAIVTDAGGKPVELEGDEVILTKKAMADEGVYEIKGTPKEIASYINNKIGGGVKFDDAPDSAKKIFRSGGEITEDDVNSIRMATGGIDHAIMYAKENNFEIAITQDEILKYLTKESERYTDRDLKELEHLFDTGVYVEQDQEVVLGILNAYFRFYSSNPNFKKIPLVIYQNTSEKEFGEGEVIRYDFLHNLFIFSDKKGYYDILNADNEPINALCGFVYEKYIDKLFGAFMHEYGHYINIGNVPYISDKWLTDNSTEVGSYISLYAQENRIEYLAEVFALKNIPNFNELSDKAKGFIKKHYDDKLPKDKPKLDTGGKIKKGDYIVHVSDKKSLSKITEEPMHFGTLEQSYNRSDALNYGNDARFYKTKVKKDWKIYDATDKEANILAKDLPTGFDYDAIRYENEVEGEGTSYIVLTEEIDIEPLEQDDFYALGGGVESSNYGDVKPETKKLLDSFLKNAFIKEGDIQTASDGEKYRYDTYKAKYPNTPKWMSIQFDRASAVNDAKFKNLFYDGDWSFNIDRAKYKGQSDGRIRASRLVVLGHDKKALGGGVDVPKGKISPKELRKELKRLESLYREDLTPIQIQYIGKAVFKIKELTREFKHDISRDERIKTSDKAKEVEDKFKALAMLDKNYLKSLKGKLNEDYAYHFTDKYGLGEIVENPQIAPQLSLTTFPYFAEPSLGTVKNYRGMGINKNTQFFSDLDVKIVFDLQKLRKEQTLKNGSRTQQTHFGEYELIWVDDKKKPANILDFILWIELKKKNKKSILNYEIDDWEGEETTIGEVLKENGIETKEWKPVDVEAYLFKGKKPKYAKGGGVDAPKGDLKAKDLKIESGKLEAKDLETILTITTPFEKGFKRVDFMSYYSDVKYKNEVYCSFKEVFTDSPSPIAIDFTLESGNRKGRTTRILNEFKKRLAVEWNKIDKKALGGGVDAPKGDCYVVAGQVAMGITPKEIDFVGTPYVVHGEVKGQGAIEGLKYGHAWIEDDVNVYDWSNGRELDFPKEIYYLLGGIEDKKGKLFKYTFDEARRKMLDTGHYGSWDLKTKF